jgi:hypothetical protein
MFVEPKGTPRRRPGGAPRRVAPLRGAIYVWAEATNIWLLAEPDRFELVATRGMIADVSGVRATLRDLRMSRVYICK